MKTLNEMIRLDDEKSRRTGMMLCHNFEIVHSLGTDRHYCKSKTLLQIIKEEGLQDVKIFILLREIGRNGHKDTVEEILY
jgi:hypothetical protein